MTRSYNKQQLYERFLDALTDHTKAASELRASELRILQNDVDSATAKAERVVLKHAEQLALRRYTEARKVYIGYKQASAESNQ